MGLALGLETMCKTECSTFNDVVDTPKRLLCVIRPVMALQCNAVDQRGKANTSPGMSHLSNKPRKAR
jgi:hypothetical protein